MSEQLLLDLPHQAPDGFFFTQANSRAIEAIQNSEQVIVIGPKKSGKTQIARHFERLWQSPLISTEEALLTYLRAGVSRSILVDDIDRFDLSALFHLYNLQKNNAQKLVGFTSRPSNEWSSALPDLRSRLQTMVHIEIDQPDDPLIEALLIKNFLARGHHPSPKLIHYLGQRIERDYNAIIEVVSAIDKLASQRNVRVSRQLAREIMGEKNE